MGLPVRFPNVVSKGMKLVVVSFANLQRCGKENALRMSVSRPSLDHVPGNKLTAEKG